MYIESVPISVFEIPEYRYLYIQVHLNPNIKVYAPISVLQRVSPLGALSLGLYYTKCFLMMLTLPLYVDRLENHDVIYVGCNRTLTVIQLLHFLPVKKSVVQQRECLQDRFLVKAVSAGFTVLALSTYATVYKEYNEICP
jgi:hypothetical protein